MAFDCPIIDAHHHLWDLDALDYPWLKARGVRRFFGDPTPIQRNYLASDLQADARGLPVIDTVHVQVGIAAGLEVAESRWLQEVADGAAGPGWPGAIVAHCDLSQPDARAVLAAHRRFRNLRGIRQILGRAPDDPQQVASDALIDNAAWRANLGLLPELQLSFDLQLIPAQMDRVADLLEGIPTLRVALCHCGSPQDQSTAGLRRWRAGLARLASLPNVYCKVSGFGMFDPAWTTASIRPLIGACVEEFGAARTMFGSNFPVERLCRGYEALWRAYDEATTSFPQAQRERMFSGTAREFYRLAPRAEASGASMVS